MFIATLACVSSAPFGLPVVPDVYRITAVSLASVATDAPDGDASFISAASVFTPANGAGLVGSAVIMNRCGHVPACSQPACPSAPNGSSGVPWKQKKAVA